MPHYQYTAMDAGGKTVKSIIEAESQQALIGRLRDGGFHVLDVVEAKGPKAASLRSKGKMKPKSLVVFS